MNWFFSCWTQSRATFQQNLGQAGWKEDAVFWQVSPAEQSTNLCVTLSTEHSWVRHTSSTCLCSGLPAPHVCRAKHQHESCQSQCALQTSGSPQGQAQADIPKDRSWIPELLGLLKHAVWTCLLCQEGGAACYLINLIENQSTYFFLHTTAAREPVPLQADPSMPGRNLTGFSFNILAPSPPLLLYIYSKN